MAAQFATQFVRLEAYVAWAYEQGCRIQSGFATSGGDTIPMTIITAPSGRYAVIHNVLPDEALPAGAFKVYDRRLGLNSPF